MKVASTMTVEAELANIRPVILGAVVRGLEMESDEEMDAFIKQLMDHQENSTSLLVEDADVQASACMTCQRFIPPFTVKAVDRNLSFVPLAMENPMTIDEILSSHPKGSIMLTYWMAWRWCPSSKMQTVPFFRSRR